MITSQQLLTLATRKTPHRLRAEAMGFQFMQIEVVDSPVDFGWFVRCLFRCVCGKIEALTFKVGDVEQYMDPYTLAKTIDPAYRLYLAGSFSREHLLKDGYTEDQVAEMMEKAAAFDARQQ